MKEEKGDASAAAQPSTEAGAAPSTSAAAAAAAAADQPSSAAPSAPQPKVWSLKHASNCLWALTCTPLRLSCQHACNVKHGLTSTSLHHRLTHARHSYWATLTNKTVNNSLTHTSSAEGSMSLFSVLCSSSQNSPVEVKVRLCLNAGCEGA